MIIDATIRRLEIIGEAVKNISEKTNLKVVDMYELISIGCDY